MTNDEAKFLLNAYRPNGRDAVDPAMAEALAQAKADPGLGAWFAREQEHAAVVAAKLREIAPPAGLRDAILAGARASKPPAAARARWRQPVWLAAAAAIAILVSAATWWWMPVRGGNLQEFAVNVVAHGFRLQKRGADVSALQQWLAEKRGPLPTTLPAKFAQLHALGCRKLEFRGRDVSLVCFERDGREFHVFVARRGDFPNDAAPAEPKFFENRKLVAAAWSDVANHYVVVSDADMSALKRLL
jgi:hypothetical protein